MKNKNNKKLTLDNFSLMELKDSSKAQGGDDGGGATHDPPSPSEACFPPPKN